MGCCHCDAVENTNRLKAEVVAAREDRDVAYERRDGLKHQLRVMTMERDAALMCGPLSGPALGSKDAGSRLHLLGHDFEWWIDLLYQREASKKGAG